VGFGFSSFQFDSFYFIGFLVFSGANFCSPELSPPGPTRMY
jgi:hypothetical protein